MADEKEQEEDQDQVDNNYSTQELNPETVPPLTDEQRVPQQDGAIPQDSKGISDGQYDALEPIPNEDIKFSQGNFQQIAGLPKVVTEKVAQLRQQLVPLIEVSLIELLGHNQLYKRTIGNCNPAFDEKGQITIQFMFQYVVESFIGQDIPMESIQHDSQYILNRIRVIQQANITQCSIDCNSGEVTIAGTI